MDKKKLPIGVFDSGIGGLTVLYKLIEMFPNEDFVYVGDTLHLPYGTKSKDELKVLVSDVANYLNNIPVKAIVIACNTATTNSSHLKDSLSLPIIGVIEPTAKYALSLSENILVLATNVTIDSNAYQDIFEANKKQDSKQYYVKASDFVDAIEAGEINTEYSYELVKKKLSDYKDKDIDVIVCGCTHFGLYEKEFKKMMPKVNVLECAYPTGLALKESLEKNDLLSDDKNHRGEVVINLTLMQDNFFEKIKWFDKPIKCVNEIKLK